MRPIFYAFILTPLWVIGQLTGTVKDAAGKPLEYVSVYIEDSFIGTVTNDAGVFLLQTQSVSKGDLIFKYLGYETQRVPFDVNTKNAFEITLIESVLALSEVTVNATENPAHPIIRAAQRKRKENLEKSEEYTADYYSRGIIRTKNLPKRVMGQKIDMFDEILDSTRSGILYLSETRSKLYSNGKRFKEVITASKVSGDDQGYSYNSAKDSYFSFYENSVDIDPPIASPIGNAAFGHYRYTLAGTFYDASGALINQIEVKPKSKQLPAFTGTIYVVEDDWALYGVDVYVTKEQTALDTFRIKQTFNFNKAMKEWVKATQVLDFEIKIFGFNFNGRFSGVFSDYNLKPTFEKKTFDKYVFEVREDANKKDSVFWSQRPIPLTLEEQNDYLKKDSLQIIKRSPAYLDSIQKDKNKWRFGDVMGKTFYNTTRNNRITWISPLARGNFNPVQGYYYTTGFQFREDYWEHDQHITDFEVSSSYGISDKTWYPKLHFNHVFNKQHYARISFSAGKQLLQYDDGLFPDIINSISSLFFKENHAKWYEKSYAGVSFYSRISPSLTMRYSGEFQKRRSRVNSTNFSFRKKDTPYEVNLPSNGLFDFESHQLYQHSLGISFYPGTKIWKHPERNFYESPADTPSIHVRFSQALGSDIKRYNYAKLSLSLRQTISMGTFGESSYALRAGSFFNKEHLAFSDFQHFHGNEIFFMFGQSLNSFQLLPFYERSTMENYATLHWEHGFRKWGVGRWPLIKQFKGELIIGAHGLAVKGQKPYAEFSIGIGNLGFGRIFRGFRVDYFRAIGNIDRKDGFLVGFKIQ